MRPHLASASIRLAAGLTLVALGSCATSGDRRLVDIFFDDPPPRAGDTSASEEETAAAREAAGETAEVSAGEPAAFVVPKPVWRGSEHGPFVARMCQACHVQAIGANPAAGGEIARLRRPLRELCLSCHEPRGLAVARSGEAPERWHGPVAAGLCIACHHPHRSREPSLLRRSVETLCTSCHAPGSRMPDHPETEDLGCLECHDPHAPLAGIS